MTARRLRLVEILPAWWLARRPRGDGNVIERQRNMAPRRWGHVLPRHQQRIHAQRRFAFELAVGVGHFGGQLAAAPRQAPTAHLQFAGEEGEQRRDGCRPGRPEQLVGEQLRHRHGDAQPPDGRAEQQHGRKARRHRRQQPAQHRRAGDGVPDNSAEQPLVGGCCPELEERREQVDAQRTWRQQRKQPGNHAQEQRGNSHRLLPRWSLLAPRPKHAHRRTGAQAGFNTRYTATRPSCCHILPFGLHS